MNDEVSEFLIASFFGLLGWFFGELDGFLDQHMPGDTAAMRTAIILFYVGEKKGLAELAK